MITPARLLGWRRRRRRPERVIDRAYPAWAASNVLQDDAVSWPPDAPLLSILMPVRDPPPEFLAVAIGSVLAQGFLGWELCITDDGSVSPVLGETLSLLPADTRINAKTLDCSGGIAAATNAALAMAQGDFIVFLDHDDLLAPGALSRIAAEIMFHPAADLIFSDEDKIVEGRQASPYFKPGWNPDLMLGQNLVSHLGVYRRTMVEELGGLRQGFEGSQDFDLALRASRLAREIRHVPEILYHWRQSGFSFSASKAALCADAAQRALTDHLGDTAQVEPDPVLPQWTRIVYPVASPAPLVSVILSGAGDAPRDEAYPWIEIVRGDLQAAKGAVLLFLSPHLKPCASGWLRELVSQALRPEIGCAGARLDLADGSIAHAGYELDPDRIAQSLHPGSDADDPGYRGQFRLMRSVSAVSEACLAVCADIFRDAGGFDAEAGGWRAVDLCLRLAERGLRSVWTPHARLSWLGAPPPDRNAVADDFMRRRWGHVLACDPYRNKNLLMESGNSTLGKARGSAPGPRWGQAPPDPYASGQGSKD